MSEDDKDNPISDDELWQQATRNDRPLKNRKKTAEQPNLPKKSRKIVDDLEADMVTHIDHSNLSYLEHDDRSGVDGKTADRIKKGKMAIDARLDLHGKFQDQALDDLRDFINRSFNQGKRLVLVITGKGNKPDGSKGVLMENVPRWLNLEDLRPKILMFSYAQPKDGGQGALYVLLKKNKKVAGLQSPVSRN